MSSSSQLEVSTRSAQDSPFEFASAVVRVLKEQLTDYLVRGIRCEQIVSSIVQWFSKCLEPVWQLLDWKYNAIQKAVAHISYRAWQQPLLLQRFSSFAIRF